MIYKQEELPHLRIPMGNRQLLRQAMDRYGIKITEVQFKNKNYNYVYKTKIITHEHLDELEQKTNQLKDLIKNARHYLNNELDKVTKRGYLKLSKQSLKMGKSKSYLAALKEHNPKHYRYLKFIGKGNFVEADMKYKEEMQRIGEVLYETSLKFKSMKEFGRYLQGCYNNKYRFTQSLTSTVNNIITAYNFQFHLFERAKEIEKFCKKVKQKEIK